MIPDSVSSEIPSPSSATDFYIHFFGTKQKILGAINYLRIDGVSEVKVTGRRKILPEASYLPIGTSLSLSEVVFKLKSIFADASISKETYQVKKDRVPLPIIEIGLSRWGYMP